MQGNFCVRLDNVYFLGSTLSSQHILFIIGVSARWGQSV